MVSPPIYNALVRAVGSHTAERILVAGEMMESERAQDIGLIDELADDPESAVTRAIEWCEQHLALPQLAMLRPGKWPVRTLHGFFDDESELGVDRFVDIWFSDSTQATLTALVERLASK